MNHKRAFFFLWASQWALWLAFANNASIREMLIGAAASGLAAVVVARFEDHSEQHYRLRMIYLRRFIYVPQTIVSGTWNLLRAMALRLMGRRLPGGIVAVHFRTGSNGPPSRGRRALAITFLTLGPNSLVLGFPSGYCRFFFHTLIPQPLPRFMLRLGALPRRSGHAAK